MRTSIGLEAYSSLLAVSNAGDWPMAISKKVHHDQKKLYLFHRRCCAYMLARYPISGPHIKELHHLCVTVR